MDETPIKAGRKARGKLHQGYFWPICGESDEMVFHYADSRASSHIRTILGERFEGVLLTDGYEAYARYAERHKAVVHAGCWAHTRRHFESAVKAEPGSAVRSRCSHWYWATAAGYGDISVRTRSWKRYCVVTSWRLKHVAAPRPRCCTTA